MGIIWLDDWAWFFAKELSANRTIKLVAFVSVLWQKLWDWLVVREKYILSSSVFTYWTIVGLFVRDTQTTLFYGPNQAHIMNLVLCCLNLQGAQYQVKAPLKDIYV